LFFPQALQDITTGFGLAQEKMRISRIKEQVRFAARQGGSIGPSLKNPALRHILA